MSNKKICNKTISILLIFFMVFSYMSTLGSSIVSAVEQELEKQTNATNIKNVEFDSVFENGSHSTAANSDAESIKLLLRINVKDIGYLKNGKVSFSNQNFRILNDEFIKDNELVKSVDIEKGIIELNQLNKDAALTIEVPIVLNHADQYDVSNLNRSFSVKLEGTYVDGQAKEKQASKEITNMLVWTKNKADLKQVSSQDMIRYIPYDINGDKGIILSFKVNTKLENAVLPIEKTIIDMQAPKINGVLPVSATVTANRTAATNGNLDGINFNESNYKFDNQTGIVNINTENKVNSENNNVSWDKVNDDEYIVTFRYSKEALNNMPNELTIGLKTNSIITAYTNLDTATTLENEYTLKDQLSNIATFEANSVDTLSKAYLYANIDSANKVETDYTVKYVADISYAEIIDNITMIENPSNVKSYHKIIYTNKDAFIRILGEDGFINILAGDGTVLSAINKDTPVNDAGDFIINITELNIEQLIVKTSKPLIEGRLELNTLKAIRSDVNYTKAQVQNLATINNSIVGQVFNQETKIVEQTGSKEITLEETTTKAKLQISNLDLSTVVTNENVEFRVILETDNLSNALYKNPTIELVLPSQIKEINIKEANMLFDDELQVVDAGISEENGHKIIRLKLQGTQTKYNLGNVALGTNIVINSDVTTDVLTPTSSGEVIVRYTNDANTSFEAVEDGKGVIKETMNFTAPSGLVTTNEITNTTDNNQKVMSINEEKTEAKLDIYSETKQITIDGKIINNHENETSNMVVLGRFPFKGNKAVDTNEDLGTNFDAIVKSKIRISGIDSNIVDVYYSENPEATRDLNDTNNGWTKDPQDLTKVKSYLLVVNNQNIATGSMLEFAYDAEVPANLPHNNQAYQNYKVYYDNNTTLGVMRLAKSSALVGLTTGVGPDLEVKLESYSAQNSDVREGQIIRYKVTVNNKGTVDAKNIKVTIPVDESLIIKVRYSNGNAYIEEPGNEKVLTIGELKAGKSQTVEYEVKVIKDTSGSQSSENVVYPGDKDIAVKATLTADELSTSIESNEYKLVRKQGKLSIENITQIKTESGSLKSGDKSSYKVIVTNTSDADLSNIVLAGSVPSGVKINKVYVKNTKGEDIQANIENDGNNFKVRLDKLETYSYEKSKQTIDGNVVGVQPNNLVYVYVDYEIQDFVGSFYSQINGVATGIDAHTSNIQIVKVEGISVAFESQEPSKEYVKELEEFSYRYVVTNNSNIKSSMNRIVTKIADGLEYLSVQYKDASGNWVPAETADQNGNLRIILHDIDPGKSLEVIVNVRAKLLVDEDEKVVTNEATFTSSGAEAITSKQVRNVIEYNPDAHDGENNIPGRYKITGTAWLDENRDGKKDDNEQKLSNIEVVLLNKATNEVVKDANSGQDKITKTGSNGRYEFNNLLPGEYVVIFLYNAGKYDVTEYKKADISESTNSDAKNMKINLFGEERIVGITDTIRITDSNIRNIDIGLYEADKFDLRLDKTITRIVTTKDKKSNVTNIDNKSIAKLETMRDDFGKTDAVVEYSIVVTNEGAVPGYAKMIVDYLPKEMKFSSELNEDWYQLDDGNLYNSKHADTKINPGESIELKLVLTKRITSDSIGIVTNTAEIAQSYNELGLEDIDSTPGNKKDGEDDMSKADLVISVSTGKIITYTIFVILGIAVISFGMYILIKRSINKRI